MDTGGDRALDPVRATLAAMAARPDLPPVTGLTPGLTVADPQGWVPAAALLDGTALSSLLDTAEQRWRAAPHVAAALAWKYYAYWLALPAVLGYAAARRVPLLRPESVLVRWSPGAPFLTLGLTSVRVAVLSSDPLARSAPGLARRTATSPEQSTTVDVVADECALLAAASRSLLGEHLAPLLELISARVRLGERTLWGSVASGVAHGVSRCAGLVPGPAHQTAAELLVAFGIDDLVEITPAERGLEIQRKTCCLAFTLPEPKVCVGCCIR